MPARRPRRAHVPGAPLHGGERLNLHGDQSPAGARLYRSDVWFSYMMFDLSSQKRSRRLTWRPEQIGLSFLCTGYVISKGHYHIQTGGDFD